MHPTVRDRLARLSPDQLAAATAPPGPVLCVAPAGSGKTTTLVARVAWRIDAGAEPVELCALTFNRRAAEELRARLDEALAPLIDDPHAVRVRTFHALGREILLDAGHRVEPLLDRATVIATLYGDDPPPALLRRLDDAFSRFKLDQGLDLAGARDAITHLTEVGRSAGDGDRLALEAFVAYEAALARVGALDFDDLVVRALSALTADASLLDRWRRHCRVLFVDETQDLDRSQLQLATLLMAPDHDGFLVGDDDQTIYAWRLAEVK